MPSSSARTSALCTPALDDVLMGRGRANYLHPGNQRFHHIVEGYRQRYNEAVHRQEKTYVVHQIVVEVRKKGRLLRWDSARQGWVDDANYRTVRAKVGQALRYKERNPAAESAAGVSSTIDAEHLISSQARHLEHLCFPRSVPVMPSMRSSSMHHHYATLPKLHSTPRLPPPPAGMPTIAREVSLPAGAEPDPILEGEAASETRQSHMDRLLDSCLDSSQGSTGSQAGP